MPKLNREKFKEFSAEVIERKKKEKEKNAATITVNMGTCGIAAGAKQTLAAFEDEIAKRSVEGVEIRDTGCRGYCSHEPPVEVEVTGMPHVIYGYVNDELARKIVDRHLINHRLVNGHVLDKPAKDILE